MNGHTSVFFIDVAVSAQYSQCRSLNSQRRLGDYVIVTGGEQVLEIHCPSTVLALPVTMEKSNKASKVETIAEEEKRFDEWEKSHHQ